MARIGIGGGASGYSSRRGEERSGTGVDPKTNSLRNAARQDAKDAAKYAAGREVYSGLFPEPELSKEMSGLNIGDAGATAAGVPSDTSFKSYDEALAAAVAAAMTGSGGGYDSDDTCEKNLAKARGQAAAQSATGSMRSHRSTAENYRQEMLQKQENSTDFPQALFADIPDNGHSLEAFREIAEGAVYFLEQNPAAKKHVGKENLGKIAKYAEGHSSGKLCNVQKDEQVRMIEFLREVFFKQSISEDIPDNGHSRKKFQQIAKGAVDFLEKNPAAKKHVVKKNLEWIQQYAAGHSRTGQPFKATKDNQVGMIETFRKYLEK